MGMTHSRRSAAVVLAGGLFLVPLAGCTGDEENTGSSVLTQAEDAAEDATSQAEDAVDAADEAVDCSGDSCTVTVSPDAGEVEVLGTTLSYNGVEDGEATIMVGDETVTCAEGDSVEAGPLTLECTTVSDESVSLTATMN
jgi:hypothetical protein